MKHKPGGGDKKIFDDKDYLRQMGGSSNAQSVNGSGTQVKKKHLNLKNQILN